MKVIKCGEYFEAELSGATAKVSVDAIEIFVSGELTCALSPVSRVRAYREGEALSDAPEITGFRYDENEGAFVWEATSTLWKSVTYRLAAFERRFEYSVTVTGEGDVDKVEYFSSGVADRGSLFEFDRGFTPIPTVDGTSQCEFAAQKTYDEFSYLTIPPLFVYSFDTAGINEKTVFALAAGPGEHNFTKFDYITRASGYMRYFDFEVNFDGHTRVKDKWTSPTVFIYSAPDRLAALEYYSKAYFETGRAKVRQAVRPPRFHAGPIACGWTEQAAYPASRGLPFSQPEASREETYDNFNAELGRRGISPTIMIIDDKWQTAYGDPYADPEKWRDLRGWIDRTRETLGRHVMLWYKLWDSEGLPDDECMMSDSPHNKRCADPSNPKYRARLKEILHRLLSDDDGCYNADGLKLDFAFFQPVGHSAVSCGGKYGVELFLEYFKFIYETAKEIKPHAVISGSPCHPLFAAFVDHARLHDYHPDLRRGPEEFAFRRDIYRIALPWSLVDTDGAGYRSRRDTMRHLLAATSLGIPDLYCITDLPCIHITDEDWQAVAASWREYSERMDAEYGK